MNGQTVVGPALQDRFVYTNGTSQEYGEPDFLYLNDGNGHFTPVSWTNGAFLDETGQPADRPAAGLGTDGRVPRFERGRGAGHLCVQRLLDA